MSHHDWERAYGEGHHGQHADAQPSAPELAGYLAGAVDLPRTALDMGCGTGADAVYLAERGIEMFAIDSSPAALELARARAARAGVEVTWIEGDVLDVPLEDSSIDLVADHGCLHHVAQEDQARYAQEVARVMRPGGRLLIRERNGSGHHAHGITEDAIRAMITDLPLRVAAIIPFDTPGAHGSSRATLTVVERR